MKTYFSLSILFVIFSLSIQAQIITVIPALPTDADGVEIIFDATQGNGGLAGYTGDVYAHTGVITNNSSSTSDWKYVKSDWGVNIPACKLTSLGNNKWKLTITPSIRAYYEVPAGEQILQMAFVFRSATTVNGSWLEGKTATGGDIFYDVYNSSLSVNITNPDQKLIFVGLGQPFEVSVSSMLADSTLLYADGVQIAATTGTSLAKTITPDHYGRVMITAVAKSGIDMVADTLYFYVRSAPVIAEKPSTVLPGINYFDNGSVILCLYAPLKEYVFVLGDFNNWLPDEAYYAKRTPDGKYYWLEINNLTYDKEYIYQYLVDGSIYIGDPYATKISDPWNDKFIDDETYPGLIDYPTGKTSGVASVLQINQPEYNWTMENFQPPAKSDMIIYELLLRDFNDKHTFQSLIDTLGYLKTLGINTIELMPVSEFEGNLSWGYNPNYYFAVDKYYGKAIDFKKLIDVCHQNGMAVVMDVVFNHAFGTSPYVMLYWDKANNRPSAESPFYNPVAKHDYNVGFDMNHESPDSKYYISRVLKYWLTEFKVDGFRFDLSKGFTQKNTLGSVSAWGQYDASRIAILKGYHDTIVAANPNAVLILEHFADNPEEKELSDKGMMLWGNMNYNYGEAAKGSTSSIDLSWGLYSQRGWTNPYLVTYMESHDEEREMFRCISEGKVFGNYSIRDTAVALQRASLNAVFFLTLPGPKMIWQFGERGYDYSINYPSGTSASRLDQKPPRWDYMSQYKRYDVYKDYAGILALRKDNPLFQTTEFTTDLTGLVKKIKLTANGKYAVIIGNYDVGGKTVTPGFQHVGTWYDYMSGDSLVVTDVNQSVALKQGEYKLYLSERVANPYSVNSQNAETFKVTVAPNPVTDVALLSVELQGRHSCAIQAFDASGRLCGLIYKGNFTDKLEIKWQPRQKGLHVLKFVIGNQQVTRKVIVK